METVKDYFGSLVASGSPLINSLPENSIITPPSGDGVIKLSCFSAVIPVNGWNQCVKWGAPKRVDKEKLQVYNLERKGNGVFECKYSKTLFFCNQNQS